MFINNSIKYDNFVSICNLYTDIYIHTIYNIGTREMSTNFEYLNVSIWSLIHFCYLLLLYIIMINEFITRLL